MLLEFREGTVIETVVQTLLHAGIDEVFVVTGFDEEAVRKSLEGVEVHLLHNPDHATGMGSSIAVGIAGAGRDVDGYMLCLGDMPLVRTETIRKLLAAFTGLVKPRDAIVRPVFRGVEGHPVLIGSSYRSQLAALAGDHGARSVLDRNKAHLTLVDVFDVGVFTDIDSIEDYRRLRDNF